MPLTVIVAIILFSLCNGLNRLLSAVLSTLTQHRAVQPVCCTMEFNVADLHTQEEALHSSVEKVLKAVNSQYCKYCEERCQY